MIFIEFFTFRKLGFNFPEYFSLDFLFFCVFASFIFFFKRSFIPNIYLMIVFLLFMILSFTNIVMFNIYGNVFSINMLFDVGEGMDVFSWSFILLIVK